MKFLKEMASYITGGGALKLQYCIHQALKTEQLGRLIYIIIPL